MWINNDISDIIYTSGFNKYIKRLVTTDNTIILGDQYDTSDNVMRFRDGDIGDVNIKVTIDKLSNTAKVDTDNKLNRLHKNDDITLLLIGKKQQYNKNSISERTFNGGCGADDGYNPIKEDLTMTTKKTYLISNNTDLHYHKVDVTDDDDASLKIIKHIFTREDNNTVIKRKILLGEYKKYTLDIYIYI